MVITASEIQGMINMEGLIVMPFHPTHIGRIEMNRFDQHIADTLPDFQARLETIHHARTAWTIFYRREPALVMGMEYRFPTNYEAWLIPGTLSTQRGTLLSRGARRFFDKIGNRLNLRRMQIVVNVHNETAIRWAEFLKFKHEGRMSQYGPEGDDYHMYARTY